MLTTMLSILVVSGYADEQNKPNKFRLCGADFFRAHQAFSGYADEQNKPNKFRLCGVDFFRAHQALCCLKHKQGG